MVNPRPLQARPYGNGEDGFQQIALQGERGERSGVDGGREEYMNGVEEERTTSSGVTVSRNSVLLRSRTSELTIAFEGEVYVFPAVTPEKVWLFLLLRVWV